jgi:hypothetical protein
MTTLTEPRAWPRTRPAALPRPFARPAEPWLSMLRGLVVGLLAGALPAALATWALRALPLAPLVLHGRAALIMTALLTACIGLATAVCFAAARDRA